MKEKRPVYNGYDEYYFTGYELKERLHDQYLLERHNSAVMAISITEYLTLRGIKDETLYRVFLNDCFCKVMRSDTDGYVDFFGFTDLPHVKLVKAPQWVEYNMFCPECGAKMKLKTSRFGVFSGCSNYPICKYKESIPYLGTLSISKEEFIEKASAYAKRHMKKKDEPV